MLDSFDQKSFAPGKIMLSGEWSILKPGNSCIALSIDKGIYTQIKEDNKYSINSIDFSNNKKLIFVENSIFVTLKFLRELNYKIKKFSLVIESEISLVNNIKLGLGSSSATVISVIKSILKLHEFEHDKIKDVIFKLGAISNFLSQDNIGSCYDIAVAAYCENKNEAVFYTSFDFLFLKREIRKLTSEHLTSEHLTSEHLKNNNLLINLLVKKDWPLLNIEKIALPKNMKVIIGFVGKSADTVNLVKSVLKKIDINNDITCEKISYVVKDLYLAIKKSDQNKILSLKLINLIKENRKLLNELSIRSGETLETDKLKKLCDIAENFGGAGKLSGAGGGDCGIAVCFDEKTVLDIKKEWKKHGIESV